MKSISLILLTFLISVMAFGQIEPTNSPYYSDGSHNVLSDTYDGLSKDLLFFYPEDQPSGEKYPIFVFQPGANGLFGGSIDVHSYDLYMEHLASYGWVVVIIDHTSAMDFTFGDEFNNTVDYVIDQAADGSGHWLSNYADVNRIVVGGHSNGGVHASAFIDDNPTKVHGIVYMASYSGSAGDVSGFPGKALSMAGTEDSQSDTETCYEGYEEFSSEECKTWVLIEGLAHGGFGDYDNDDQPVGSIGRDNATGTVRHYLVSWLESEFKDNVLASINLNQSLLQPNTTQEFENSCNETVTEYTISASANPSAGGSVTGAGTYAEDASCTVTATANSGYEFVNWSESGSEVSTNASYTFTVTSNRTLVANFEEVTATEYTISASANPSAGGSVSGTGTYAEDASCTLTATPNSGYEFINWTESGSEVSTNASYTFTVTSNRTLVANFSEIVNVNIAIYADEISVYPNPASENINIENLPKEAGKIQIISINGQVVFETIANDNINISSVSAGNYLINILDNSRNIIYTERINIK
jgi:dienelactone hydrolase